MAAGTATNNALEPNCEAPLQPSVSHVSQNEISMNDGVTVFMHASFGAPACSQKHDRWTISLPFTVEIKDIKYLLNDRFYKIYESNHFTNGNHQNIFEYVRLTELFDLFTNSPLIGCLTVWIQLAGWVCAFNIAPTSLIIVNRGWIEWIRAETSIWSVRATSPTFYGWCCERNRKTENHEEYWLNCKIECILSFKFYYYSFSTI